NSRCSRVVVPFRWRMPIVPRTRRKWRPGLAIRLKALPVLEDFACRVVSGNTGDAAPRVRGRAALVQADDRRAVVGPMGCGTLPEQLIGRELAVEDMALGQPDDGLEVRRDQRLETDDLCGKPGRHLFEHRERRLGQLRLLIGP